MPGHMVAALTAYPEIGCKGGGYDVWHSWGVNDEVLCAGNDSTYRFVDDVLGEIMVETSVRKPGGRNVPNARPKPMRSDYRPIPSAPGSRNSRRPSWLMP